jgi:hypothetical protein
MLLPVQPIPWTVFDPANCGLRPRQQSRDVHYRCLIADGRVSSVVVVVGHPFFHNDTCRFALERDYGGPRSSQAAVCGDHLRHRPVDERSCCAPVLAAGTSLRLYEPLGPSTWLPAPTSLPRSTQMPEALPALFTSTVRQATMRSSSGMRSSRQPSACTSYETIG